MNAQMRFTASVIGREPATVRIASSDPYRLKLNGDYVGYGPARGPKGHFRVDEWPLACTCETNLLEIDVAGYNAASYYFMQQTPFLEAEVCRGTNVLLATGTGGGFEARRTERVQKTIRYSGQRMFTEVYGFGRAEGAVPLALSVRPRVRHLPRIVPYPRFKLNSGLRVVARSRVTHDGRKPVRSNRSADWMPGTDVRTAFAKTELEVDSWRDAEQLSFSGHQATDVREEKEFSLCGESVTVDAGLNDCGFPGMTVEVRKPGRILFLFDEILTDGGVDYDRLKCVNVIEWMFDAPGRYEIESFEPYVFRYAEIVVPDGEVTISDLHIRTYKNPSAGRVSLKTEDRDAARIFEAARETFAQNAVDVFTDCPSRERAGWLCDSYWIARSSQFFTGSLDMERLFLENYLLDEGHDVPKGMVPMCYPADHRTGRYIPNWAMWLVLELEDYVRRGGDRVLVERFRPKMLAMKRFFDAYRNSDGLLERLPSWVFVEWSHANKLVQDVNYPSNMLWARALGGLAWLYGREDFADEAKRMRQVVGKQSWTGEWFCDNAVRGADGRLKLSGECTETCQYYAFFTGTVDARTHSVLWKRLVEEFGPARRGKGLYPEIWPSNAFIGNYLRLELLAKSGLKDQLVREIKGYFLDMARQTGTLWEHDSTKASCSHGFASYVAVLLSGCHGG